MLKKTITYTDFDGNERTEDHYFNLTRAELIKLRSSMDGGLENYMASVVAAKSGARVMELIDTLIRASYGQKSLDGRKLMKSEEIYKDFEESLAYDQFYTELVTNDEAAAAFIRSIVPATLAAEASAAMERRRADASKPDLTLPAPTADA